MDLVSGTAIVFFLLAILAIIIFAKTASSLPHMSIAARAIFATFAGESAR